MTDTERLHIVAEELLLTAGELEALLSANDSVRDAIAPSELIAAVSRGEGILLAAARQAHPSHPSGRRGGSGGGTAWTRHRNPRI